MQRLWDIEEYTENKKEIAKRKASCKVKGTYPPKEGYINGIRGFFQYPFDSFNPGEEVQYTEYVILQSPFHDEKRFGCPGDSGSIVAGDDGTAIGMIIASDGAARGSRGIAVFTPLQEIFEGIKASTRARSVSLAS